MSLENEVLAKSKEIYTDNYPMSIGELANIYRDKELELHPEFQRQFRWSQYQKTRLIESLLLGIPTPPIFVVQREDGIWDVIDGLQRLSTIFEFMRILRDENDKLIPSTPLYETKFLPSLKNIVWPIKEPETESIDEVNYLPDAMCINFKRVKIGVNIIKSQSDTDVKYEMFQRLNTGGSNLTAQEIRNCLIIMKNKDIFDYITSLSQDENFINCTALSEKQLDEKYDMELVCRYLTGRISEDSEYRVLTDINDFINSKIIELFDKRTFDRDVEKNIFAKTFLFLAQATERPFTKYDTISSKFKGMFLVSAFETISIGLAENISTYDMPRDKDILLNKVTNIWTNSEFTESSGSGVNARARMTKTIPFGKKYFKNEQKTNNRPIL